MRQYSPKHAAAAGTEEPCVPPSAFQNEQQPANEGNEMSRAALRTRLCFALIFIWTLFISHVSRNRVKSLTKDSSLRFLLSYSPDPTAISVRAETTERRVARARKRLLCLTSNPQMRLFLVVFLQILCRSVISASPPGG